MSYEAALAIADNNVERCKAWIGQVAGMRIADRHAEALNVLDLAEPAAAQNNLAKELAQVHYYRGSIYFPLGKIDGVSKNTNYLLPMRSKQDHRRTRPTP